MGNLGILNYQHYIFKNVIDSFSMTFSRRFTFQKNEMQTNQILQAAFLYESPFCKEV